MLFGDSPKGNEFADASVGENNIDSPLHPSDRFVKTIKVGQFGNVSLNSRNVGADVLHGLVEFLLSAARNEKLRLYARPIIMMGGPACLFLIHLLLLLNRQEHQDPVSACSRSAWRVDALVATEGGKLLISRKPVLHDSGQARSELRKAVYTL